MDVVIGSSSQELMPRGYIPPADNQKLELRMLREKESLKREMTTNIREHKKQTKKDIEQVSMTSLNKEAFEHRLTQVTQQSEDRCNKIEQKFNNRIDTLVSLVSELSANCNLDKQEQQKKLTKMESSLLKRISELESSQLKSKHDSLISLPPLVNTKPNHMTRETTPTTLTTLDKRPPITTIRSDTGYTDDYEYPSQLQRIRNRQSNGSTPELNPKRLSVSFSPVSTPDKLQSNLVRSQQRLPPISNSKPTQKDVKRHSSLPTSSTVWLELTTSSPKNSRKQLVAKRKTKTTTYKHTQ